MAAHGHPTDLPAKLGVRLAAERDNDCDAPPGEGGLRDRNGRKVAPGPAQELPAWSTRLRRVLRSPIQRRPGRRARFAVRRRGRADVTDATLSASLPGRRASHGVPAVAQPVSHGRGGLRWSRWRRCARTAAGARARAADRPDDARRALRRLRNLIRHQARHTPLLPLFGVRARCAALPPDFPGLPHAHTA